MEFKRNYSSNIQPPTQIKANNLMNPISGITNASTPVRTRIIKPGSQLNSTPVNVHKIGMPAKSPTILNKQNQPGNCKLALKRSKPAEPNLNLSPIMALNRKMSEGPQLQQRSFTPNGFRRQQSMSNIMDKKDNGQNENLFGQTLKDSRTSNGFRSMLESRSKTPTKIAFGQIFQKQSGALGVSPTLRTSGSAQALLQGFQSQNPSKLRQSRNSKLVQSRSFQQLINMGTPATKQIDILCSNSSEHQRKVKAKYKVVQDTYDEQILVYCSKCAINLVQKGFKVQDLTLDDIRKIKNSQSTGYQQVNSSNQYYDYASQTNRKIHIKLAQLRSQRQNLMLAYQKQIDDVQCYYSSIISLIEQQRCRDREAVMKHKQKEKNNGEALQRKLCDALGDLGFMLKSGRVGNDQLPAIQQIQSLLTEQGFGYRFDGSKCLLDRIQPKFNHFSELFENQGRLRIEGNFKQTYSQKQYNDYSSNNEPKQCPLRFSFEKNMKQARKSPLAYRNSSMNALEQAPQCMQRDDSGEGSYKNEKKAFRTLFPQDQPQFNDNQQRSDKQTGIHSPTFKQI